MRRSRSLTPLTLAVLGVWLGMVAEPGLSLALTTFGKSSANSQNQNQNSQPPPAPIGKARECRDQSDCRAIQDTACMPDIRDGKQRCLCGDFTAPDNGACSSSYKPLRAKCQNDDDCMEGAECNSTMSQDQSNQTPWNQQQNSRNQKVCLCKEGYTEANFVCNGSPTTLMIGSILTFASFLLLRLLI